jgi:hypothetical protein
MVRCRLLRQLLKQHPVSAAVPQRRLRKDKPHGCLLLSRRGTPAPELDSSTGVGQQRADAQLTTEKGAKQGKSEGQKQKAERWHGVLACTPECRVCFLNRGTAVPLCCHNKRSNSVLDGEWARHGRCGSTCSGIGLGGIIFPLEESADRHALHNPLDRLDQTCAQA